MKRRDFCKKAALGTLAGGALVGCRGETGNGPSIVTQPNIQWNLASSFGPSLDVLFNANQWLAQRVSEITDGKFRIRVYGAGELVPALQVMDAVQQGTVEIGQTASYYFTGKNPALAFDTTIPFGLTARQQVAWMFHGGGLRRMREVLSDFNIIPLPSGGTGAQMGGWFRREIGSLQDLRGLKMRIPGMGGEVMDRLGVTVQVLAGADVYPALERGVIDAVEWVGPHDDEKLEVMDRLGVTVQVLAGADVYPALERGVIDAVEWVGPHDDEKLGFHKVARFYYYPGWWEPGPTLSLYINRTAWDDLPRMYQSALEAAAAEVCQDMLASYDAKNPAALKRLQEQGVQLKPFASDMMDAAYQTTRERLEEMASRDTQFRTIYEEWKTFRETSFNWFAISEQSYANTAFPKR